MPTLQAILIPALSANKKTQQAVPTNLQLSFLHYKFLPAPQLSCMIVSSQKILILLVYQSTYETSTNLGT